MDEQGVREELARILAHPRFSGSDRLSRFLDFVVQKKLGGESEEIKEYVIALEVYQRKPDYDPKADSLVRVEASRLRSRLDEYYGTGGARNPIRISLPKGSYVPEFEIHDPATVAAPTPLPHTRPSSQQRRWLAALGLILVIPFAAYGIWRWQAAAPATGQIKSIAVLPFVYLSGDPQGEAIVDGLTEELTTLAAGLDGIKVAARTSAYQFKNKAVNVSDAGRQLGVDGVIEGSVRQQGDRFRVTAQLIQVSDGYHLWAQSYEWESTDAMALEKRAAATIAGAVQERLLGASPWRVDGRGLRDPAVFRRYLEAHDLLDEKAPPAPWTGSVPDHLEQAARILEEVTASDQQFAAAWAFLGQIYEQSIGYDANRAAELIQKAQAACRKALELDDTQAEAHSSLGTLLFYRSWDFDGAAVELRRAVEINPRSPDAQSEFADLLLITGHKQEALVEITRALSFSPSSEKLEFQIGYHLLCQKDYSAAQQHASRALALSPDYLPAIWLEGLIFEDQHRWNEAEARYRRVLEIRPDDSRALPALGHLLGKTKRPQEAEQILAALMRQRESGRAIEYWLALIELGRGNKDAALTLLEQAYEKHDSSTPYIGVDPRLEPLWNEPRFLALKQRLKLG